jgi:hypothetical protein
VEDEMLWLCFLLTLSFLPLLARCPRGGQGVGGIKPLINVIADAWK